MTKVIEETKTRSILKSISWRVIALLVTILIVFVFTDDLFASANIAIVGAIVSSIAYYIHERIWASIHWGYITRKEHDD